TQRTGGRPMSMEMAAWNSIYHAMHAQEDQRPFSLPILRRIASFARPHSRQLGWFLTLSVFMAALAVASPLLAGEVVNAIVDGSALNPILFLAGLIAMVAVAEAALSLIV